MKKWSVNFLGLSLVAMSLSANIVFGGQPEIQKTNYYSGALKSETRMVEGVLEGEQTHYYENGKKERVEFYKKGKKQGMFTWFDTDGSKTCEVNYIDDKAQGVQKEWENGKLSRSIEFKDGLRHGKEVRYNAEGVTVLEANWLLGDEDGVVKKFTYTGKLNQKSI
ncbi:MAG: hypothetical protein NT027_20600, partial [Proteobacteria bacterium]|nr:hypothetical protein [Pseudomonadota bacterium]